MSERQCECQHLSRCTPSYMSSESFSLLRRPPSFHVLPRSGTSQLLAQALASVFGHLFFYILFVNATIPAPQWSGCGQLMSQLRRGPLHSRQCYDQVSSHLQARLINSFTFSGQLRQSNSAKETSIWATCRLRHWLDHERQSRGPSRVSDGVDT